MHYPSFDQMGGYPRAHSGHRLIAIDSPELFSSLHAANAVGGMGDCQKGNCWLTLMKRGLGDSNRSILQLRRHLFIDLVGGASCWRRFAVGYAQHARKGRQYE
ncbi:hypothetical protein MJ570_06355 [Escherichia coli]|nr:hypothetical protein MJ570_06355 [Escherichia coli]